MENDIPFLEFDLQSSTYRLDADRPVEIDENTWVAATIFYWQGALTLRLFVDGVLQDDLVEQLSIPVHIPSHFP